MTQIEFLHEIKQVIVDALPELKDNGFDFYEKAKRGVAYLETINCMIDKQIKTIKEEAGIIARG